MTQDNQSSLEAQVLSSAVEMGLSNQLDQVDQLNVDVQTNLIDMVQGQANSVSVAAQGLVMENIRVQEMEMHAYGIAINPLSAIFGDIELTKPTDATIRIVLKEKDINHALTSDYVRSRMQSLELTVNGEIITFNLGQMEMSLTGNGKIQISANTTLQEGEKSRVIGFRASIYPPTIAHPLLMESFQCAPGQSISFDITLALMQKLKELMSLPYFEIEGTALRIKQMEVEEGKLTVEAEAYVRQIPSM